MVLQRAGHAAYDTKYHLLWAPKYRKWVLRDSIRERVGELLKEIAEHHGSEIEEMEIAGDHVHVFLSFSPRYSIAKVVAVLKSISASVSISGLQGLSVTAFICNVA